MRCGQFDQRIDLNCVDAATGEPKWSRQDFGKGSVTLAHGHLFITTKKGDLITAWDFAAPARGASKALAGAAG